MKTTLLRSAAASALLVGASLALPAASTAAFAQANNSGTTPPAADSGSAAKPAPDATKTPAPDATKTPPPAPTDTNAQKTPPPADNSSAANKPADGDKIVKEQQESQVLASTYIGQSVYNSNNKSIGDISDLVFDQNGGGIEAAVIGVGGFLGIGQKNVAVKFDRIKIERKPNSADVKLVTDMTADELKQAPAFKNLQTKMNEKNANQPPASGTTTGGTMGTTGGAAGGAGSMTPGAGTGAAGGSTGAQ